MRRTLCALACLAAVALIAPAASSADVLDVYQGLAARKLHPAPLVPTTVPRTVSPLDRTIAPSPSRRRKGYGVRLVHYGPNGPNAIVVLEGGSFKTMKAALADGRRLGFKPRRTRVRGHRGYLLTRHLGPTQWLLVWPEDGRIYTLGTGTPKKVPLKQLRATAKGLDHLGRDYIGAPDDPDNFSEGSALTTDRTVTRPGGLGGPVRDGPGGRAAGGERGGDAAPAPGQRVHLRHRAAPARVRALERNRLGNDLPDAIVLTIRATGTIEGMTCDSGPLSFALDQHTN